MTEWDAAKYARISDLQAAMADEQLSRLRLGGNETVLDVGCGDGKITAKVAARLPRGRALGVDPSREMIEFAADHFRPPAHPNLRFEVADVRDLPYAGDFDLVVSFNALHWVTQQDAALRCIHKVLKPGARAVLRFVPAGERQSIEDVIEETRESPRWGDYFRDFRRPYVHFTEAQYREMSERNGLKVVGLRVTDHAWNFGTREAFVAFCRVTFVEWTKHLPEGEQETFITDVLNRYQLVAACNNGEANTFKFYQMEVTLARPS